MTRRMSQDTQAMLGEPGRSLPRELAPGLHRLGACLQLPYKDTVLHAYNSVYLLSGADASILIEAGFAKDLDAIERQPDELLAAGAPEVRYLFVTHAEPPHSSGIGLFLDKFPSAQLVGDVRDLELIFPQFAGRTVQAEEGDEIDLGGTRFRLIEAVLRDYPATLWGFDTARRALFPGDGFAYMHHHAGQCACVLRRSRSCRWARWHPCSPRSLSTGRATPPLSRTWSASSRCSVLSSQWP